MKNLILATLIISIFCFSNCKKNTIDSNGLPKATQEGKNTLGFLLNGKPWTPKGFNGTANLSFWYDATLDGGVFNIATYHIITPNQSRQRLVMFGDSIQSEQKIILPNPKKFGAIFRNDVSGCDYDIADSSVKIIGGYFEIIKLDKSKRIFSALFSIKFKKNQCEEVNITEGRFDMKF